MDYVCCPECQASNIDFVNDTSLRMGFANKLVLTCMSCKWSTNFFTSNQTSNAEMKQGRNMFEINVRNVVAFREIEKGHEPISNFARCTDMQGISASAYRNINESLFVAYENAANVSMQKACSEIANDPTNVKTEENITLCRLHLDGAWQKMGHSSHNGYVAGVNSGKVVDVHVMSKYCRQCQIWEPKKYTDEYQLWHATHIFNLNHTKSSGAMESAGAVEIFQRSVDKNKLVYNEYLGDGDTSSFKDVVTSKPYEKYDIDPIKLECIGHVQKRLGTRLRNLVKQHKGTSKPLHGKGKLTDKIINSLQNIYGLAIRQNCDNLYQMKKAVGAILWHCIETDQGHEYRHRFCPTGKLIWCKFKKDQATNQTTYKKTINLPK